MILLSMSLFLSCGKNEKSSETKRDETRTPDAQTEKNTTSQNANDINPKTDGIKNLTYEVTKAPEGVKYDGKIVAGAKWQDSNGENILIITETTEKSAADGNRAKELYGYHYTINGGSTKLLWKINDFIKECPVDITLEYMPKSISITDLDKNGIAESTFLYRMSCKGDVSADDMKLLMHEGETKYAVRGTMNLIVNGENIQKGTMNPDASFDKAPKSFSDYAKTEWSKYQTEKIGNK
jgi:hypothetical protein